MSSLDIKKFKKILQKYDITLIDYYISDKKCMFIKVFINITSEFLLIYIPSRLRFETNSNNSYDIIEIEENGDLDDYSSSSKIPNIEKIDEEKSHSKYEELTKKYKKNISLEDSDEPLTRKIKRQLHRLKIPFSSLKYDIVVQYNKYFGVSFGDTTSIYMIKNYDNSLKINRQVSYLVNLNDLIENIDNVGEEIENIKQQFYDIVNNSSFSNFQSIKDIWKTPVDYDIFFSKKEEYKKSLEEYKYLYVKLKEKENELIKEYQKLSSNNDDAYKRTTNEGKIQKQMNELFYSKNDVIKKGMIVITKYHKNLLILEEVSFDNSIMIDRVHKNFQLLKE
jgi:hypothetical protein